MIIADAPHHVSFLSQFLAALCGIALLAAWPAQAQIADSVHEDPAPPIILRLEPTADPLRDKEYAYRKMYQEKTIAIMLYGFHGNATPRNAHSTGFIPKDRQSLDRFFKHHVDRITRDYIGDQSQDTIRIMTGEPAFTSTQMNRGIDIEPARMAGITIPVGKMTFGGGYTWGEKNPALMMPTGDGIFAGFSYDTGRAGFQASFLTSGQEILGWEVGGNDYRYSSLMLGTSFRVNKRMAVTTTLQFRNDNDPGTTGDKHVIATIGTSWRW